MSVHDPHVVIRTEEVRYVGGGPGDRVALHRDPRAAFDYDAEVDAVAAQIAVVDAVYAKVWTAVPLAQAIADAGLE
jgi:hypothetical protein